MTPDEYLGLILTREAVDISPRSPVRGVQAVVEPIIRQWAGGLLAGVSPSGSFAKGTGNRSSTDIDLFISLSERTPETLKEIYESLFGRMREAGYSPKRQNVSINVRVDGMDVDLVPGRRQGPHGDDHSLFRRRADTWTKTNIQTHVNHVTASGRTREIRVIKLWRSQWGLDFPSFYVELTVINALAGVRAPLSENVVAVLRYLSDTFPGARMFDPANSNNVISDDLAVAERLKVKAAAERALASNWSDFIK